MRYNTRRTDVRYNVRRTDVRYNTRRTVVRYNTRRSDVRYNIRRLLQHPLRPDVGFQRLLDVSYPQVGVAQRLQHGRDLRLPAEVMESLR